jgi:tryptophan synthase beta chain
MNSDDKAIIINMSGRGEKDLFITSPHFRPEAWRSFLKDELSLLDTGGIS